MYLTNYKRVPRHVIEKKDSTFGKLLIFALYYKCNIDVKQANVYWVESGHAEIESNRILLIFGNALEVLHRSEFHESVEEIYIEYNRFDLIVNHANLEQLKKFKNLKKISVSHNHLHSFIVLSKLECLTQLRTLEIWNNEILKCRNLKSFVVYRFQYLTEFNQHKIDERDKKLAKMNFHIFDRLLSMDNVWIPTGTSTKEDHQKSSKSDAKDSANYEVEKNDSKLKAKKNYDYSYWFVDSVLNNSILKSYMINKLHSNNDSDHEDVIPNYTTIRNKIEKNTDQGEPFSRVHDHIRNFLEKANYEIDHWQEFHNDKKIIETIKADIESQKKKKT